MGLPPLICRNSASEFGPVSPIHFTLYLLVQIHWSRFVESQGQWHFVGDCSKRHCLQNRFNCDSQCICTYFCLQVVITFLYLLMCGDRKYRNLEDSTVLDTSEHRTRDQEARIGIFTNTPSEPVTTKAVSPVLVLRRRIFLLLFLIL